MCFPFLSCPGCDARRVRAFFSPMLFYERVEGEEMSGGGVGSLHRVLRLRLVFQRHRKTSPVTRYSTGCFWLGSRARRSRGYPPFSRRSFSSHSKGGGRRDFGGGMWSGVARLTPGSTSTLGVADVPRKVSRTPIFERALSLLAGGSRTAESRQAATLTRIGLTLFFPTVAPYHSSPHSSTQHVMCCQLPL